MAAGFGHPLVRAAERELGDDLRASEKHIPGHARRRGAPHRVRARVSGTVAAVAGDLCGSQSAAKGIFLSVEKKLCWLPGNLLNRLAR
jgi:hypothetical protein